jgi:hypothetical protein
MKLKNTNNIFLQKCAFSAISRDSSLSFSFHCWKHFHSPPNFNYVVAFVNVNVGIVDRYSRYYDPGVHWIVSVGNVSTKTAWNYDPQGTQMKHCRGLDILSAVLSCAHEGGASCCAVCAKHARALLWSLDIHVAATLRSNERDRSINASFFFDPEKCPKILAVGDKVRLTGTRLQMWNGDLHLTGKNII